MQLPSKYHYLQLAQEAGISTPATLFLPEGEITPDALQAFIQAQPAHTRFIVRSANADEDGSTHSMAGHFWSSEAVTASELTTTLQQAYRENAERLQALHLQHTPHLMLQTYVEHTVGGVAFSPWSFFSRFVYVETAAQVQDVVAGLGTPSLISLDNDQHPLPPTDNAWVKPLQGLVQQLQTLFKFPLDIEWVFNAAAQVLTLVQVRPQTHLIGAIQPAPAGTPLNLPHGYWQFAALSESVGRLSPLSFELLQQLYQDARPTLQNLGLKAENADFMQRLPDGTVLIDSTREQRFFQPTKMGGFWQGFRAPVMKAELVNLIKQGTHTTPFSYEHLSSIFSLWVVANHLSQGAGREQELAAHRYELSWNNPPPALSPLANQDWGGLNEQARSLFFHELGKLKQTLSQNPERVFCTWLDYSKGDFSQALTRQCAHAQTALYDYLPLLNPNSTSKLQSLSVEAQVAGSVFYIAQPAQFRGALPQQTIVVAPYFDNRWVSQIKELKAIIVERGSRLAHSTLVAREHKVPFCVVSREQFTWLQTQTAIKLDTVKGQMESL